MIGTQLLKTVGVVLAAVVGAGSWLVVAGKWGLTAGDLVAFLTALAFMYRPVRRLSVAYNKWQTSVAAAGRVFEVLDTPVEEPDADDAASLGPIREGVSFEHVGFAYEDDATGALTPVLEDVTFEIPAGSGQKWEVDKVDGTLRWEQEDGRPRVVDYLGYPGNYGMVPRTLLPEIAGGDGDPLDVLVVTPIPVITGAVIRVRPIGMLCMTDESGPDAKVLAVPIDKLSGIYSHVNTARDLPKPMLDSISHFFDHYKDLEPGKWNNIDGWVDADDAKREILESVERYKNENK